MTMKRSFCPPFFPPSLLTSEISSDWNHSREMERQEEYFLFFSRLFFLSPSQIRPVKIGSSQQRIDTTGSDVRKGQNWQGRFYFFSPIPASWKSGERRTAFSSGYYFPPSPVRDGIFMTKLAVKYKRPFCTRSISPDLSGIFIWQWVLRGRLVLFLSGRTRE